MQAAARLIHEDALADANITDVLCDSRRGDHVPAL